MVPVGFAAEILSLLAPGLAEVLSGVAARLPEPLEEVRLRAMRPLQVVCAGGDHWVSPGGRLTPDPAHGLVVTQDEVYRTFQLMARGSVYAWESEVRQGFLTLGGGHRVGLAGRTVAGAGTIETITHVGGLNIRVAREVIGAATGLLPRLLCRGALVSTLLVSPPGSGKTTVLRDLIRQVSTGVPALALRGRKVAVVDERSELAGCLDGVPQRDVGPRTDVLDGCPKAEGVMVMIRAMSPDVVAVDEIGRPADADALMEALHAGVAVLATAHGSGLDDLMRRPGLARLLEAGAFRRLAVLGRSRGPGTVEQVHDLDEPGGSRLAG